MKSAELYPIYKGADSTTNAPPSLENSIQAAEQWINSRSDGGSWTIPVISECLRSTGLSLLITEGTRQRKTMDYLLENRVWEKGVVATAALVWALVSKGERELAIEIARKCIRSQKLMGTWTSDVELLDNFVKRAFPKSDYSFGERIKRLLLRESMKITSRHFWTSRSSQAYCFIPEIASLFLEDKKNREKITELIVLSQNRDGSFGGMTLPTVKGAYVLQMLGQEGQFRKALAWLENVSNDDGSLKAIRYQDVYDTALAALALSDNENLDKTISWLEKTKVEGQGFPYYSGGYYPDCDDTSLVLLAKKAAGYEIGDTDEVNFLLKSQNPDRGWSYVSFYSLKYALPYRYLTSLFPKIQNAVRKEGLSLLWHPIFDSAVDMTSRVLITLANTSESVKGRKGAISKGVSYLMRRYHNGSFHGGMRWADSDTYETSLALIALSLSNAGSDVKSGVVSWLLSQRDLGSDELAHIIWACCIAGVRTQDLEQTVRMLVSSQNEDGSWSPRMSFRGSAPYLDPLFSTAMPLLALKTVSARNKEDVPALS